VNKDITGAGSIRGEKQACEQAGEQAATSHTRDRHIQRRRALARLCLGNARKAKLCGAENARRFLAARLGDFRRQTQE
jgi:hypothetical protein